MSDEIFRTLIVTAADAPVARAIAAAFGPGGVGMFSTPLSASGLDPATHYISTGYIPAEFVALAPIATWEQDEEGAWVQVSHWPGMPEAIAQMAATLDPPFPLSAEQVAAVFDASDISEQEPFVAMGRMGLALYQEDIEP